MSGASGHSGDGEQSVHGVGGLSSAAGADLALLMAQLLSPSQKPSGDGAGGGRHPAADDAGADCGRAPAECAADGRADGKADVGGLAALSDYALVEAIEAAERLASWAHAFQLRAIAQLYTRPVMLPCPPPPDDPADNAAACGGGSKAGARARRALDRRDLTEAEVAACLRISSNMAATRLATARALTTRLPSTLSGLQHGRLDAYRAQIIAEHVTPLADAIHDRMIGQGRSPAEAERAAIAVATTIEDRVLGRPGDLAGTSPGAGGPRPDQTPTQLRASVKRAVIAADRAFAEDSRQQALKTRKVTLRTDLPDAMAALNIDLPAPEALAVWNVLDSCARELRSNGDPRTLDQLRTDTLVYLVLIGIIPTSPEASGPIPPIPPCETTGTAPGHPAFESEPQAKIPSTPAAKSPDASTEPVRPTDPECPTSPDDRGDRSDRTDQGDPDPGDPDPGDRSGPGRRSGRSGARVQVTVALDTLTGTANEPAELTGYGPITADLARAIAQHPDSTWRRLVTDPLSGQLLDYGRTTYRPPAALAEYVAARDVTCIHPNCSTPAEKSDLDHLIPYPRGTTSQENLRPLCRRHHRLKHEGGWRHRPSLAPTAAPGTIDTTSPTGHRYRRFQPAIGPSRRQETLATSTKPNHTQDLRPPPF